MKFTHITIACMTVGLGGSAWAVPFLQLDILGASHYDPVAQTLVADENPFSIRALIDASSPADLSRTYYLSAAVAPYSGAGFGSFTLLGVPYSSDNMTYGLPPVHDGAKNPAAVGILPTYYTELSFTIDSLLTPTVGAYDAQTGTTASGDLYYVDFLTNIAGLTPAGVVHFDLYTYDDSGNQIDAFAPYAHNPQSGTNSVALSPRAVPDGGMTLTFLGLSLGCLGYLRRKLA